MLPTSILAFLSFVLELCSASPVYNMQPAFITTHIGTTGRNIRNLPCVSRKTNEKGICMFAINCLKANGTHLGTCIDKFYFGSCCHIPPVNDIENTIDTDIIPSREPPHRLSTLKPVITTLMYEPSSTSSTTHNISSSSTTTTTTATTTTNKPTTLSTKEDKTTTESKISTTFKVQNFSKLPAVLESTEVVVTTAAPKLTTFLSINGSPNTSKFDSTTGVPFTSVTLTSKPFTSNTKITSSTTTKVTSRVTTKPTSRSTTKPYSKATTKPVKTTSRPRPTTSFKPTKTSKPSKSTTKKPPVTVKVSLATRRQTTTKRPISRKPTSSTTVGVKITTREPSTSSTTRKPVTTTTPVSTSSPSSTIAEIITSNEISNATTSLKPLITSQFTTEKPALITWTVDDIKRNTTEEVVTTNATTEEWKPITTPDGWVLLPSVSSVSSESTSTKEPEVVSTSSPEDTNSTTESMSFSIEVNVTTQSPSTVEVENLTTVATATTLEDVASTVSIEANTTVSSTTEMGGISPLTTESGDSISPPVNMSDFTNVCGRRMFPEARIVGGEKSSFGKWPWQISLRQWRTSTYLHKCGAALLNENWAITAAHCVDNVPPSDLLLRLGEHDLSTESEPYLHQERRVQIVASHPQFDPRTFEYDLALLRFYEPVTFQPNIIPVCVPQTDENFVGRTAHVTGWGRLYEDGPLPSILQEVSVPVINNSVCESMYRSAGYIEHIPHIFICAGWRRGGFDSCEGDSGGPMVIQRDDKRFLLAGVISWGIGCAEPNQPGVYTRISEFRDWINQILQF